MNISLEANREMISTSVMNNPEPDLDWKFTDAAGHVHTFDGGHYPSTVEWAITDTVWCDDCQETHDEGEWRCKLCGEKVEPHWINTGPTTLNIPGLLSYTLTVERLGKWDISKDEYDQLIAAKEAGDLEAAVRKLITSWGEPPK